MTTIVLGSSTDPATLPRTRRITLSTAGGDLYSKSLASLALSGNVLNYGADPTGVADSTSAFQDCLDSEIDVFVPPGEYIVGNITVTTDGTRIHGCGEGSKLTFKTGSTGFMIDGGTTKRLHLADLLLYGGRDISYNAVSTSAADRSALNIATQVRSILHNVTISGFDKYGIKNSDSGANFGTHLRATNVTVVNTWQALLLTASAEYTKWSNFDANNCYYGIELTAGNVTFDNCIVVQCSWGVWIRKNGNVNSSHGNFNGGLINHCSYGIKCEEVEFGFNFNGINLHDCVILLDDCQGVNITNGILDPTAILMKGGLRNYVRNNYIPGGYANTITHDYEAVADDTVLEGNYFADGTTWGP